MCDDSNPCLQSAAVCLAEVAIIQANSPHVHTRLAEVYYTIGMTLISCSLYIMINVVNLLLIGSRESLTQARHHYSISLHLLNAEHNLRALYGLIATCTSLLECEMNKK